MWLAIAAVIVVAVAAVAWVYAQRQRRSVRHPRVVENYRIARAFASRRQRGEAGTEELRQAVVNYRALFDDLLKIEEGAFRRRAS
jgi:hypothetical protein